MKSKFQDSLALKSCSKLCTRRNVTAESWAIAEAKVRRELMHYGVALGRNEASANSSPLSGMTDSRSVRLRWKSIACSQGWDACRFKAATETTSARLGTQRHAAALSN